MEFKPFTEKRPWGEFRQYTDGTDQLTVKTILVHQGECLSLQFHHKREEFWTVLGGSPEIVIGDKTIIAKAGDEFTIAREVKHRISAPNDTVTILEISRGEFDENDIMRLEDNYGR